MFDLDFLHELRAHELELVATQFAAGARVLEIGGGTGLQARELARRGFDITSVDVESSYYRDQQIFPVAPYDGVTLPFPDRSFDAVFTSSVLEHVLDIAHMHAEIRRVLRPDGKCVHVLPSSAWRFWSSVSHYPDLLRGMWRALPDLRLAAHLLHRGLLPPRHGETGSACTELRTFRRAHWIAQFRAHGFEVEAAQPMGLFYTGNMVLGARWPLASRRRAAALFGSACIIYRLKAAPGA